MTFYKRGLVRAMEEATITVEPTPSDGEVISATAEMDTKIFDFTDDSDYISEVEDESVALEKIRSLLIAGESSMTAQSIARIHTEAFARRHGIRISDIPSLESHRSDVVAIEGVLGKIGEAVVDAVKYVIKKIVDMIDWFLGLVGLKKKQVDNMDKTYEASKEKMSENIAKAAKSGNSDKTNSWVDKFSESLKTNLEDNRAEMRKRMQARTDSNGSEPVIDEYAISEELMVSIIATKFSSVTFAKKLFYGDIGKHKGIDKIIIPKEITCNDIVKRPTISNIFNRYSRAIKKLLKEITDHPDVEESNLDSIDRNLFLYLPKIENQPVPDGYDRCIGILESDWVECRKLIYIPKLSGDVKVSVVTERIPDLTEEDYANIVLTVPTEGGIDTLKKWYHHHTPYFKELEEAKKDLSDIEKSFSELSGKSKDDNKVWKKAIDLAGSLIRAYADCVSFSIQAHKNMTDALLFVADTPNKLTTLSDVSVHE